MRYNRRVIPMRRVEKEIMKLDRTNIGAAARMAKRAGYIVECYDGDGESGPQPPALSYYRESSWRREAEARMSHWIEMNI
jgi:hypothetical protein